MLNVIADEARAVEGDDGRPIDVGSVVVTDTLTELPLSRAAASVTVLEGKTLRERNYRNAAEALREVPGLDVVQNGGPGGTTSVFLRGGNSNHTLVLIDGVEVNSPTDGAFDFADLTIENIERIEVVRGPQSTLYGADAMTGVIQIITRRGKGPTRGSVTFEGGSYRTFREVIGFRGANDAVDYTFSAARLDTEGFSRTRGDGNTEDDAYQNSTLSARLGAAAGGGRLDWTARFTDAESELDGCGFPDCPVEDPNFDSDTRVLVTGAEYARPFTSWWSQRLKFGFHSNELQGTDPDLLNALNNYFIETHTHSAEWRHELQLGPFDRLILGFQYDGERAKADLDKGVVTNGFYALNQLGSNALTLNVGIRHDDHSRFGGETTYKGEAAIQIAETGTKLRAAYGTAFRAPTLNDLFFPGFSNPDLDPERSVGWEAGVEQSFRSFGASGTYFDNRVEDLIAFVSVEQTDPTTGLPIFISRPKNVSRSRLHGIEAEAWMRIGKIVRANANYTFTDAQDEDGLDLARRPRHKASGAVTLQPASGIRAVTEVRWVGDRFSASEEEKRLEDYIVVNLSGWYELGPAVEFFTRIENLFNRDYQEVAGYATAGASVYGGLQVMFQ